MKLGELIKTYREKKNISMQEFADKAGLSKGYISMIENDYNPQTKKAITPSLKSYRGIAIALDMQIDDMLKLVDPNSDIEVGDDLSPKESIETIAAHAIQDLSEEEIEEVLNFARYIKSKHKDHRD